MTTTIVTATSTIEQVDALRATWEAATAISNAAHAAHDLPALALALVAERDARAAWHAAERAVQAQWQAADVLKEQIAELLDDCDLAHIAGMELARVQPGTTKTWDTTGLLRFCDTLRRTENGETAEAIMAFMKHGERAGYFRIAALRETSKV